MVNDKTLALYILHKVFGYSNTMFRALLERDFDFTRLLGPDVKYLQSHNVPDLIITELQKVDQVKTEKHLADIRKKDVEIIGYFDDKYPVKLRDIYDPPSLLYSKGAFRDYAAPSIAVVGTRKCTEYGCRVARELTAGLAASGITIISGMAEGIDTVAHKTALENNSRTVAVLGGGFNRIFPASNTGLFRQICEKGSVLSEYEPGIEARAMFFPIRNRIVTGLADGVLIIEGDITSGSMISAYSALDQGRNVYAVPGPIDSKTSKGPHKLLRDGAKLVETIADILEEQPYNRQQTLFPIAAGIPKPVRPKLNLNQNQQTLMGSLSQQPVSIDELVDKTGLSTPEIIGGLLELEVMGAIRQLPGKRFVTA